MHLIVFLGLIAAAVVALRHGPGRAMLAVYLPLLLLVPDGFRAITPGLPDPNFHQAAVLPILAVALLRHGAHWRPRWMDGLVLAFAAWVAVSDGLNRGYADAQNLMFAMLTSVLAPYAVARLVVGAEGLQIALMRRFVLIVAAVAVIGLWEARFGYNPFHRLIGSFFPGQGTGWVTTFRHGLARVAGPYSHAILAGMMMATALLLQRWLQLAGHWPARWTRLPGWPWSPAATLTGVLGLGLAMTVARGPWLGALLGWAVLSAGAATYKRRALARTAAALAVAAFGGAWALSAYLDVQPGAAMSMSQESAFYRKVLVEKYVAIALDRAWLGWGLTTWPKVRGMPSIDNYYLLIALMHGLPALGLLLALLLLGTGQCLARGLAEPQGPPSPGFALAGVFLAMGLAIGTVYLGEQVLPTLFLMLGVSQAWLADAPAPSRAMGRSANLLGVDPAPRFRAVIH